MEPRSLERGNLSSGRNKASQIGFNGAAFSRTRKQTTERSPQSQASLQWSRVISNAETDPTICSLAMPAQRFNGAAFSRTRKPTPPLKPSRQWLQWSRVLSNAETTRPAETVDSPMLQWSRVLSNAETAPLQSPQRQRCGIIFASGRWPYTQYRQYDQSNPSQVVQPQSASAVREMMSTSPLADRSTIKESPQIESATRLGYHRSTRHNRQNRNGCTGSRER